ncbi:MAG: hypothetical protein MI863_28895 [Desulfobacterales bacterium]|nr:hypothetical protein [Desulfobacterales bacterium]
MKTIKIIFLLIILGLLGTLVYQNQEYFLAATALHIDFKISSLNYTAKALPNIAYWGICFGLGLLLIGLRGLFTAFRLGREVKERDARIETLKGEVNTLKTRLDVFIHDPYIKNKLDTDAADAAANADAEKAPEAAAPETPAKEEA